MDSDWVCDQTRIYLIDPLRHHLDQNRQPAFVSGGSFVYFLHPGTSKPRRLGPDFYVVSGGTHRRQTKWVAWEEDGLLPTTIIEFASPSTESRDRGHKFCVYRDIFKTEDYFIILPDTLRIEGFHLSHGRYVALSPAADGWFWVNSLGLWLGVLDGWIRLRTAEGELLTTGRESAEAERQRADAERQRAKAERQRAEAERQRAKAERQRAEAERQRAEAERQKAEAERQRPDIESQNAKAERQRAEAERQRADAAEAEVRALREQLSRLKD